MAVDCLPGRAPGREGAESLNYRRSRVNRPRCLRAALAALFGLGFARAIAQQAAAPIREQFRLLAIDDGAGQAEMESLAKLGEEAALEALADLARDEPFAPGVLGRRRCAHLVFEAGGERCIPPAIAVLSSVGTLADAGTRSELLAFLARADLGAADIEARVGALAERALDDPDPVLRSGAVGHLAGLDRDESWERLDAILPLLEEELRGKAALLLADRPRARVFRERRAGTRDRVLRPPFLAALGRDLGDRADASGAGPLLRALRDPDPAARRAGEVGLDAFVRRLHARADAARAVSAIGGLDDLGLDPTQGALWRARAVLVLGADARPAIEAAQALANSSSADRDEDQRSTLAVARHVAASAHIALGDATGAEPFLAEEASLLDGLLAERLDRQAGSLAALHAARLHRRAQCELLAIVQALAGAGVPPEGDATATARDPVIARCLESARRVHALELEAQIAEDLARDVGRSGGRESLDGMFEDQLSPVPLVFENPRLPAWPGSRVLWMRRMIGRVFASVATAEAPGFEPFAEVPPRLADPLQDPERLSLLKGVLRARFDAVASRLQELRLRVRNGMTADPTKPSEADEEAMLLAMREWEDLLELSQRVGQGDTRALLESRAPSLQGLALARALREEGREEDARALAGAVRKDLEESGDLKRFLLVEAEIEMTTGSTWIDSGDPARAEIELVRAVERLESIETSLLERGASLRDLGVVRGMRASALVSLAVNANVKLHDVKKAVAYFERAFELRQDEFMRVLLACYRARVGRDEEARAILREISPTPGNLYNLACTWALLGEGDLALDCLKRDLEENPMSAGAREKQKEWARKDPDLGSLRDDPRFKALVGE